MFSQNWLASLINYNHSIFPPWELRSEAWPCPWCLLSSPDDHKRAAQFLNIVLVRTNGVCPIMISLVIPCCHPGLCCQNHNQWPQLGLESELSWRWTWKRSWNERKLAKACFLRKLQLLAGHLAFWTGLGQSHPELKGNRFSSVQGQGRIVPCWGLVCCHVP